VWFAKIVIAHPGRGIDRTGPYKASPSPWAIHEGKNLEAVVIEILARSGKDVMAPTDSAVQDSRRATNYCRRKITWTHEKRGSNTINLSQMLDAERQSLFPKTGPPLLVRRWSMPTAGSSYTEVVAQIYGTRAS